MSRRDEIEAVVEAALFAAPEPVKKSRLVDLFPATDRRIATVAIDRVIARYAEAPNRGVCIEEVAGGLRLATRPELHGHLRRLLELAGPSRLSMAALETLAIVAYRQPVTAPEIQELRGVNSAGVLKTLLERRLIRIAGRKMVVGKPFLYVTTRQFLIHFGLTDLADLPPLEEFEEMLGELAADGRETDGEAGSIDDPDAILGPEPVADDGEEEE